MEVSVADCGKIIEDIKTKRSDTTYHCMDSKDKVKKVSFNVLNSDTSRTFQVKTAYTMPSLQA
jgi:hypothetical protein